MAIGEQRMPFTALDHPAIACRDVRRLAGWYCETFGMRVLAHGDADPPAIVIGFADALAGDAGSPPDRAGTVTGPADDGDRAGAGTAGTPGHSAPGSGAAGAGAVATIGTNSGAVIELMPAKDAGPDPAEFARFQPGIRHVALRVSDFDAAYARLRAAGVRFTTEPGHAVGGGRTVLFRDPEGNELQIVQRD